MQKRTSDLICSFADNPNYDVIPSIIIGLQEEDHVCESLEFSNCFKWLRNICAHEPAVFVNSLKEDYNHNCATIYFKSISSKQETVSSEFTMQLYQFTAWMFSMYQKTNQAEYIMFWHVFCRLMCPALKSFKGQTHISLDLNQFSNERLWFRYYEQECLLRKGKIRYLNNNDYYLNKIYREDKRLFLKMVIPDMMQIVSMLITEEISPYDKDNINGYLTLFKEREGN